MPTLFDLFTDALSGQHARLVTLETAADADLPAGLVVERFEGREGVNELFWFDIDVLSTAPYIKLKKFIGEEITLRLLQADGHTRAWHGYCTESAWLGSDGGLTRYRLRLEPFFAFLRIRRNCLIFHDQHAQAIVTQLLADYPQAHFTCDITPPQTVHPVCTQYRESDLHFLTRVLAAEGLSWRFQHAQDGTVATDTATSRAKHLLVIFDPHALAPDIAPGGVGGEDGRAVRFHGIRATDRRDAITQFIAQHRVQPNAVAVSRWDPSQLNAPSAEQTSAHDNSALPRISLYDPAPARRQTTATAAQHSDRLLQACELHRFTFAGAGSVRHLAAGHTFSLTQHDSYPVGANDFTVLWIEHAAVNNLDTRIIHHATALPAHDHHHRLNDPDAPPGYHDPERLTAHTLEHGTYRNRFSCVRHTVPIVPLALAQPRLPTALGPQIAHVIAAALTGDNAPITTDRDHRVLIRFPWQRPVIDPLTGAATPAPGQWARVSEALAGPNWGSLFTPRVGTEVLINFIDNDIDHPMIVGCLYNGDDLPPYSAGVDSNINHPGTLSGIHSHGLDGQGYNQWQIDDSAAQLRMRLASSRQTSQLNLGHLIAQVPGTAQRGAYRGQGFELRSDAHSVLRGGEGVFISTTARPGHGASVTATQLDTTESHAQLKRATDLTQALSDAATHQGAQASPTAAHSAQALSAVIDPLGALDAPPSARLTWASPVILMDSPASLTWITPASTAVIAAAHLHSTSQTDTHLAAAQTLAAVAGNATTLFTHSGGIQAIAANGPVSLHADTDALDILADDSVTVTSVNGAIAVTADKKIVLHAGQASITLEDINITLTGSHKISVKGGVHRFKGGASNTVELAGLPSGLVGAVVPLADAVARATPVGMVTAPATTTYSGRFQFIDPETQKPTADKAYRIMKHGAVVVEGKTDSQGYTAVATASQRQDLILEFIKRM